MTDSTGSRCQLDVDLNFLLPRNDVDGDGRRLQTFGMARHFVMSRSRRVEGEAPLVVGELGHVRYRHRSHAEEDARFDDSTTVCAVRPSLYQTPTSRQFDLGATGGYACDAAFQALMLLKTAPLIRVPELTVTPP